MQGIRIGDPSGRIERLLVVESVHVGNYVCRKSGVFIATCVLNTSGKVESTIIPIMA